MFGLRPSDAAIVRRTLQGRPQAFEALVFRYQNKAHAIARALGLRAPDVDDAVQEAFLQTFRDLPSLRDPGSFGPWFLNIVRHVSIKELRRARRSQAATTSPNPPAAGPPTPSAPASAEELEQRDFREYLWRRVAELPQGTREAIFLYYYEGESVRAVARSLGLSISGAHRRLRSGKEELREKLWRGLELSLRESLPSGREWRATGRRLSLLVLASTPAAWTARAGEPLALPGGGDAVATLARRTAAFVQSVERPIFLTAAKYLAALAALAALVLFLGKESWMGPRPQRSPPAIVAPVAAKQAAAIAARAASDVTPQARAALEPPSGDATPIPGDEALADASLDSKDRGSVLIRVIWGDTRTPAAGVSGQVIPWGSPDLYIDERTFTSGPDGIAHVAHIFKGGASVMLDRGGRVDVRVTPGEESEAVIEVPPGVNVQGVVVDQAGSPVGGAHVWISYSGHMNWGSDVATTWPDGSFLVRSISASQYIAARADGHVTSDLRPIQGEAGATLDVRLVLNGVAGEVVGNVQDEAGEPVAHAKVMVGAEYPGYTLLDDGKTGFSPPPYVGFTDEEGRFHAISLAPGKTRVAVRAPGFVPLAEEVEVPSGRATEVELTLERGATLTGHVKGAGEEALTGAQVVIGDFRDFLSIKVFSGEGGAYRLSGLPAGEVEAYAERPGFGKASAKITLSGREVLLWDPVLTKDLEVRGRVVDETGAPLEGFAVLLEQPVGSRSRRGTQRTSKSDGDGRFNFAELSDLAYRVTVFEPGCPFPCAVVDEIRPGPGDLEVRVERASIASGYLLGRVLDSDGGAYPGAKVICFGSRGGCRVYFSGKDGGFRAGPLPRGRYRIEVQAPGRAPLGVGDLDAQEGEERDVGVQSLGPALR